MLVICVVASQRGRYNKSNTSTIGSVCSVNNPAHNARKAYESSTSMLIYIPISLILKDGIEKKINLKNLSK